MTARAREGTTDREREGDGEGGRAHVEGEKKLFFPEVSRWTLG